MKLLMSQAARIRAAQRVAARPEKRRSQASVVLSAVLLVLPGLAFVGSAYAQSCAVGETPVSFGFSGGDQTMLVPAGVHSATVYLSGAQGGAGRSGAGTIGGSANSPGGVGGLAGRVRAKLWGRRNARVVRVQRRRSDHAGACGRPFGDGLPEWCPRRCRSQRRRHDWR